MNKIFKSISALTLCAAAFVGCVKDTGFEENEYGIKDPAGSPPAVAFNSGLSLKSSFGLDAATTPQTVDFVINYTGENPPQTDITVNVVADTTGVATYNTANGTNIIALQPSQYTVPSTVTIPAGQRFGILTVTIPSAGVFDPTKEYAVGLRITGASNNVAVATNLRQVFFAINIKNKYDGVYQMTGYHNRTPFTFPYNQEMDMITSGPASVRFFWPEADSYGHPIGTAPGAVSWYGPTVSPDVVFNPTTNQVIAVNNVDPAGPPITLFTGPGSYPSRYEPSTKTIYVCWNYNANPLRAFFDTLVYKKAR